MNKFFILFFTLYFTLLLQAQVTKTVTSTAGSLSTTMTDTELSTVTNLTILGTIDARDFGTMCNSMPKLAVLDIRNVTISAFNGSDANKIPDYAFYRNLYPDNTTLMTVNLPNSVTSIGDYAFISCKGLTYLNLPTSVTTIGYHSFTNCTGLTSIIIPNSVTSIGNYSFSECTGLTSIIIPGSVNSIGENAFLGCIGIITVDANNKNYTSSDGVLFDKDKKTLILFPTLRKGSYNIPNSVTSIGNYSFSYCTGLTEIIIPGSVTSIGNFSFSGCKGLINITIPNSVNSIGEEAFSCCTGLTKIIIPSSVTSIGNSSFRDCFELNSIIIPNTVTSIGKSTFNYCIGLTNITIPNLVTSIGEYTFFACKGLTSLTIPSSVTSIGNFAFSCCFGLTSFYANSTLPINLTLLGDVFSNEIKTTCTLYVPIGSKSAYQTADQWKDFLNIVETSNLTAIPSITNATLNLYPNPTTDYFQVSGLDGNALISIKDLNGKTLLTKQINSSDKININSFSKGIYMIKVTTNEGSIIKKIIKE